MNTHRTVEAAMLLSLALLIIVMSFGVIPA